MTTVEEFPHVGEHLANDESQARTIMTLLAVFAIVAAIILIGVLRTL